MISEWFTYVFSIKSIQEPYRKDTETIEKGGRGKVVVKKYLRINIDYVCCICFIILFNLNSMFFI